MKKKMKKILSVILLVCCVFSSQVVPVITVSAKKERSIVFVGKGDVQKEDFIKHLCSINRRDGGQKEFSIDVMYNNEPVEIDVLNTNSIEADVFKSNFKRFYSNSNLLILTYNANNVHSEGNLKDIIELGYENIKDSYKGKIVVLGLRWDSTSKHQVDISLTNNITVERVAKDVFGENRFAFSSVISKDLFVNYNLCHFINNLCKFANEIKNRNSFDYSYLKPDDSLMRKSRSLTFGKQG